MENSPKLKYLGHASIKITTAENIIIYIDPFAGDDYSEPADIILVTHGHHDHNAIAKVTKKDSCKIITFAEALTDGQYKTFEVLGIKIKSVPAYNLMHSKKQCVGFVIEFDGIKLYHAGDTSKIEEMAELANENITYALLPMDNIFNMGPKEATEAAKIINAKYNMPIHTGPGGVYGKKNVAKFNLNKLAVRPGETIELNT
jgi:L-ascorbate metabolism protein UlaG (beta-lactamase superfamily)